MGLFRSHFLNKNAKRKGSLTREEKIMLTDDNEETELYVL